jgi:hypothetical protein
VPWEVGRSSTTMLSPALLSDRSPYQSSRVCVEDVEVIVPFSATGEVSKMLRVMGRGCLECLRSRSLVGRSSDLGAG